MTIDCRSEEGVTIGLIDSLITISRVLKPRLVNNPIITEIGEALDDLSADQDFNHIILLSKA